MSSSSPLRRYWSLDVLRGLCALIIFVSHWILYARVRPRPGFEAAVSRLLHGGLDVFARLFWPLGGNHPAVICFFVLSGFCIHIAHAAQAAAGRRELDWVGFYRRRFFRIMPVYWTGALLGLVLVAALLRHPSSDALISLQGQWSPGTACIRFLAATDLYPREVICGNMPLNTVGIEVLLYALYPLFYAQAARGRWALLCGLFLALQGVAIAVFPYLSPFWVYSSVLMYGLFWFLGAWLAHYVTRHSTRRCLGPLLAIWAVFIVLNGVPHFFGLSVLKQDVFAVGCVVGVLHFLDFERRRGEVGQFASVRALRFAGTVSYTLYAVHTPVLLLTSWALLQYGVSRYGVELPVSFACAVAVTLVVHYRIERVFYRPRAVAASNGTTMAQSPVNAAA